MIPDQMEMFRPGGYPGEPGFKRRDTSRQAAREVASAAGTLRARVAAALAGEDMTADEAAAVMGKDILSIRPRLSELAAAGRIYDTGLRRPNASGKNAIVWRAKR